MPEPDSKLTRFVSQRAIDRNMISMHAVLPAELKRHPRPISLGLGEPYHKFQPVTGLKMKLYNNETVIVPKSSFEGSNKVSMAESLKYAEMDGLAMFWKHIRDFLCEMGVEPQFDSWGLHPTLGRNNGFHRVVEVFLDPQDVVLVPESMHLELLDQIINVNAVAVPYKVDEQGTDFDYLQDLIENWEDKFPQSSKRPKMLYTVPSGQELCGGTDDVAKRTQIFDLCSKNDLLIVEDDPFAFLPLHKSIKSKKQLLQELVPSYLTLDTTGRVIRVESFSKIIAPGLRLGYIVAHSQLLEHLDTYANIVNDFPPGPAQALVNHILPYTDDWVNWLLALNEKYLHRQKIASSKLQHHNISIPRFGGHIYLRADVDALLIKQRCVDEQALSIHVCNSILRSSNRFIRISLCEGTDDEFEEALNRLLKVI